MRLMMRSTEIAVTSPDHVENEVCRRHHHTEHQGRKRSDNGVRTKTAVRVALLSLCFCQGPRGTHVKKNAAESHRVCHAGSSATAHKSAHRNRGSAKRSRLPVRQWSRQLPQP